MHWGRKYCSVKLTGPGVALGTVVCMVVSSTYLRSKTGVCFTYSFHCIRECPAGLNSLGTQHDDVIKWKHYPRYCPFVRGIHRSPVNSPHKGQWRGALMSSLISARLNGWVNNRKAGDLRRYDAHYDAIVMSGLKPSNPFLPWGGISNTCGIWVS